MHDLSSMSYSKGMNTDAATIAAELAEQCEHGVTVAARELAGCTSCNEGTDEENARWAPQRCSTCGRAASGQHSCTSRARCCSSCRHPLTHH